MHWIVLCWSWCVCLAERDVQYIYYIVFYSCICANQETISTCQFAQRVALIRNDAVLNEELSPKLMIERLRREVQQLKDELAMSTGEMRTDALSEDEMTRSVGGFEGFYQNALYVLWTCFQWLNYLGILYSVS